MSAVVRTCACVDCATPIIGERLRCPACHDRHAALLATDPVSDDAVTSPRSRVPDDGDDDALNGDVMPSFLLSWLVAVEVIGIVVLGLIIGARSCVP